MLEGLEAAEEGGRGEWEDLPEEILLVVFSFLQAQHLCQSAQVCSKWNRVASDESLWRWLYFHSPELDGRERDCRWDPLSWRYAFRARFLEESRTQGVIRARNKQIVTLETRAKLLEAELHELLQDLDCVGEENMKNEKELLSTRARLEDACYELTEKTQKLNEQALELEALNERLDHTKAELEKEGLRASSRKQKLKAAKEHVEKADKTVLLLKERWKKERQAREELEELLAKERAERFNLRKELMQVLREMTKLKASPSDTTATSTNSSTTNGTQPSSSASSSATTATTASNNSSRPPLISALASLVGAANNNDNSSASSPPSSLSLSAPTGTGVSAKQQLFKPKCNF
ncbi:F-box only protein 11 [Balamuthia mandrillaris]